MRRNQLTREEGRRAMAASVIEREIVVWLRDGREVHVPLSYSTILSRVSEAKRNPVELLGGGMGLHWPKADEDLLVDGLVKAAVCVRRIASRL